AIERPVDLAHPPRPSEALDLETTSDQIPAAHQITRFGLSGGETKPMSMFTESKPTASAPSTAKKSGRRGSSRGGSFALDAIGTAKGRGRPGGGRRARAA